MREDSRLPHSLFPFIHTGRMDFEMRVLIVDDNAMNVMVVRETLKRAGYAKISEAYSAKEMFEILQSQEDERTGIRMKIDLILLDIMMPAMDGIEACRLLQADSRYRDIPIIIVTAIGDSHKLAEAMDAGASDFVTKPINKIELLARIRTALRLKRELDWHKERDKRLEEELNLARHVQDGVLPDAVCEPGIRIRASFRASEKLAGDLYAWHRIGRRRWALAVIDAMGHGISSSLVSMFVASMLKEAMPGLWTPERAFREMNRRLSGIQPERELIRYYCTGIYATIDLEQGKLEYANAGHPPGLLFAGGQRTPERLEATSAPLGMFDLLEVKSRSMAIGPGDKLYLYTDGVLNLFGEEGEDPAARLSDFLRQSRVEPSMLDRFLEREPSDGRLDDRCLVSVEIGMGEMAH